MKNLYISDLDGTLLDNDGKLSDENKRRINNLIKNGCLFGVYFRQRAFRHYTEAYRLNQKYIDFSCFIPCSFV